MTSHLKRLKALISSESRRLGGWEIKHDIV